MFDGFYRTDFGGWSPVVGYCWLTKDGVEAAPSNNIKDQDWKHLAACIKDEVMTVEPKKSADDNLAGGKTTIHSRSEVKVEKDAMDTDT